MAKTYSLIPDCILGANIHDLSMKNLWIELYHLVSFGDSDKLQRGQLITTYEELGDRTCLTVKQVRARIDKLVAGGWLEKQVTNRGIILTIVDYDKIIKGKGRRYSDASISVSRRYHGGVLHSGGQKTGKGANTTPCVSNLSEKKASTMGSQKGNQNGAPYISKKDKRDVVVRESDNSNNNLSYCAKDYEFIQEKQKDFKNKVFDYLKIVNLDKHLKVPEFKETIRKYLVKYGCWIGGQSLCYETIKGFSIEGSLDNWIHNERALNIS